MRPIDAYLTRENENYWMLTKEPPVIARMAKIGARRAYVAPGDMLGFRFICKFVASMLYEHAEKMEQLESVPIKATIGGVLRVEESKL